MNTARQIATTNAIIQFTRARLECHRIMKDASNIEGLPAHYRAQAETIYGLSGIKLARIVGEPDAQDFLALRDDIEAVAGKVDPLILAIGNHACENSHVVERDLFRDVLRNALDGNASYSLTAASERLAEDQMEGVA